MSDSSQPRVCIVMGSDSDLPVMAETAKQLQRFEIEFELHVTSAHRTPERTVDIIRSAEQRGVGVFVAVGVISHLTDKGWVASNHRGHGHCIAKGVDVRAMMAELFARATGLSKGKGIDAHRPLAEPRPAKAGEASVLRL